MAEDRMQIQFEIPTGELGYLRSEALAKLKAWRPEVFALFEQAAALQMRKAHDYASDEDTYSNFRCMEDAGIAAWEYALGRLSEKAARWRQYCQKGEFQVVDEGFRDLSVDIINLAAITSVLFDQENRLEHGVSGAESPSLVINFPAGIVPETLQKQIDDAWGTFAEALKRSGGL